MLDTADLKQLVDEPGSRPPDSTVPRGRCAKLQWMVDVGRHHLRKTRMAFSGGAKLMADLCHAKSVFAWLARSAAVSGVISCCELGSRPWDDDRTVDPAKRRSDRSWRTSCLINKCSVASSSSSVPIAVSRIRRSGFEQIQPLRCVRVAHAARSRIDRRRRSRSTAPAAVKLGYRKTEAASVPTNLWCVVCPNFEGLSSCVMQTSDRLLRCGRCSLDASCQISPAGAMNKGFRHWWWDRPSPCLRSKSAVASVVRVVLHCRTSSFMGRFCLGVPGLAQRVLVHDAQEVGPIDMCP